MFVQRKNYQADFVFTSKVSGRGLMLQRYIYSHTHNESKHKVLTMSEGNIGIDAISRAVSTGSNFNRHFCYQYKQ